VFQNMDTVAMSYYMGADGYLVGYSPGNFGADPGNTDLSLVVAGAQLLTLVAVDALPLVLAPDARPVIGATISLQVANITPTAPFGGLIYGLTRHAGISLAGFGMPGCFQYNDMLAVSLLLPQGALAVAVPFPVPSVPGVALQAQAVVYDPLAAPTPSGAIASQGVELVLGN
jgi:hypothetical protein